MSDAEQELAEVAAGAAGLTVPHLLAETALAALAGGARLSAADRRLLAGELAAVRRMLRAIGTNVNQLAAQANSGITPAAGAVEATMHAVASMVARLDAAIGPYEPRR